VDNDQSQLPTSAYDAIIIGTGQAGPALARRLAAAGMTVAIVERALFGAPASIPAAFRQKS